MPLTCSGSITCFFLNPSACRRFALLASRQTTRFRRYRWRYRFFRSCLLLAARRYAPALGDAMIHSQNPFPGLCPLCSCFIRQDFAGQRGFSRFLFFLNYITVIFFVVGMQCLGEKAMTGGGGGSLQMLQITPAAV